MLLNEFLKEHKKVEEQASEKRKTAMSKPRHSYENLPPVWMLRVLRPF